MAFDLSLIKLCCSMFNNGVNYGVMFLDITDLNILGIIEIKEIGQQLDIIVRLLLLPLEFSW